MEAVVALTLLLILARGFRRAGDAARDLAAAAAEASAAAAAQAEAIEQARAELADVQAGLAGLRAMLRDADRGDDDGRDVPPPPGAPDPMRDFMARRAQDRASIAEA